MPQSNAAHRADIEPVETPEQVATSQATRAAHDFANSDAMRILRDWATSPEIQAIRDTGSDTDPAN